MELKKEVYINDTFSELATERLQSFLIEDNSGLQLDSLNIVINNADDSIKIPSGNATIELAIGYGKETYKMGRFTAQNIDASSSIISIKATSQDLSKGRIRYNRVFKDKTLEDILKTIAQDMGLKLQVDSTLKTKQIAYYLQENKTSLELLSELAEIFYAIVNIKDNYLVFVSKENSKNITINIDSVLKITKQDNSSKYYNGVIYNSWNIKEAKLESTKLGSEPYLILQNAVEESIKNIYINSQYKEVLEKECIIISVYGDPNIQAGFSFNLKSTYKYSQFRGKYRILSVTHNYNNSYTSNVLAIKL